MSVIKRILEANKFSKHLPEEWEDKEYRAKRFTRGLLYYIEEAAPIHLHTQEEMYQELQEHYKPKQSGKKTDENQLSLF